MKMKVLVWTSATRKHIYIWVLVFGPLPHGNPFIKIATDSASIRCDFDGHVLLLETSNPARRTPAPEVMDRYQFHIRIRKGGVPPLENLNVDSSHSCMRW